MDASFLLKWHPRLKKCIYIFSVAHLHYFHFTNIQQNYSLPGLLSCWQDRIHGTMGDSSCPCIVASWSNQFFSWNQLNICKSGTGTGFQGTSWGGRDRNSQTGHREGPSKTRKGILMSGWCSKVNHLSFECVHINFTYFRKTLHGGVHVAAWSRVLTGWVLLRVSVTAMGVN